MKKIQSSNHRGASALPYTVQQTLGRQLRSLLEPTPGTMPSRLKELIERIYEVLADLGPNEEFRNQLLQAIPSLRYFAMSLTRHSENADDLVQETVVKAWGAFDRFEAGTNLNAWLFTIMRNQFHTNYRKRRREVEDGEGKFAARLTVPPEQDGKVALHELQNALERLPSDQREALVLVGVERVSYEEAAAICGVAVGTIKSRVNRARSKLAELLDIRFGDFGPDLTMRATLDSQA